MIVAPIRLGSTSGACARAGAMCAGACLTFASVVLLSGCATKGDIARLQDELHGLTAQSRGLQTEIAATSDLAHSLGQELDAQAQRWDAHTTRHLRLGEEIAADQDRLANLDHFLHRLDTELSAFESELKDVHAKWAVQDELNATLTDAVSELRKALGEFTLLLTQEQGDSQPRETDDQGMSKTHAVP